MSKDKEGCMTSLSEFLRGIREGVKAANEGRTTPWEDVEKELWPDKERPISS